MRTPLVSIRPRPPNSTLLHDVTQRVVGQTHAITQIVPYVEMHRAGLAPDGRPAGVVKAGLDYKKAYTTRFVNKGVGIELRPRN